MIPRLQLSAIFERVKKQRKIQLIWGPRQVGKTTLIQLLDKQLQAELIKTRYVNCDIPEQRSQIDTTQLTPLKQYTQDIEVLFVDEAQQLQNPGMTLKILHDHIPHLKVVATGSSSFELKNRLSDALTGRYFDYKLYPISLSEWVQTLDLDKHIATRNTQINTLLEALLLYGFYPGVLLEVDQQTKQHLLSTIIESYLFKDIFSFERVKHSKAIVDLTKALAYQIGSPVSDYELSNRLGLDRRTVLSYLDVLEQSFIIIRIYPYSKNPRREIGHSYKVYFTDLGIRNALIDDFNSLHIRKDTGHIWENFLMVERVKKWATTLTSASFYYWRSYSGAEVDWIEKPLNQDFQAFEFKFRKKKLSQGAKNFSAKYHMPIAIINQDTFHDFLI